MWSAKTIYIYLLAELTAVGRWYHELDDESSLRVKMTLLWRRASECHGWNDVNDNWWGVVACNYIANWPCTHARPAVNSLWYHSVHYLWLPSLLVWLSVLLWYISRGADSSQTTSLMAIGCTFHSEYSYSTRRLSWWLSLAGAAQCCLTDGYSSLLTPITVKYDGSSKRHRPVRCWYVIHSSSTLSMTLCGVHIRHTTRRFWQKTFNHWLSNVSRCRSTDPDYFARFRRHCRNINLTILNFWCRFVFAGKNSILKFKNCKKHCQLVSQKYITLSHWQVQCI